MSSPPDRAVLRTLNAADIGALTGNAAADVRRVAGRLRAIAAADLDQETKAAMLAAVLERPEQPDLSEDLVLRLLESAPRLNRVTDLLDVRGIGPQRFLAVVGALASANVNYLLEQEDSWEAALALRAGLDRGRARELLDLVAAGRAEELLGADFPLLDEVTRVVCDPGLTMDPGFDAEGFAATVELLGAMLPTPGLIALLDDDDEAPDRPEEDSAPVADRSSAEVLDERWPRPEEENRGDCPRIKLAFDPVEVEPPQLGDVRGLREIVAAITDIQLAAARLALLTFSSAERLNQLNPFSPRIPPQLRMRLEMAIAGLRIAQPSVPGAAGGEDGTDLSDELLGLVNKILDGITRLLTARIVVTRPTRPVRIVRPATTLDMTGPPGADLSLRFFSRMLSTYVYGRGEGTGFSGRLGVDLSWFAKIDVSPFRSRKVQLGQGPDGPGVQARQPDDDGFEVFVSLPRSGRLSLPVALNGNYGEARVTAQLDNTTCRYSTPLFRVLGAFREEVEAETEVRYDNTEEAIRQIEVSADAVENLIDIVQDSVGALFTPGAVVAAIIGVSKSVLRNILRIELEQARSRNRQQRKANLEIAAAYPRRLPR